MYDYSIERLDAVKAFSDLTADESKLLFEFSPAGYRNNSVARWKRLSRPLTYFWLFIDVNYVFPFSICDSQTNHCVLSGTIACFTKVASLDTYTVNFDWSFSIVEQRPITEVCWFFAVEFRFSLNYLCCMLDVKSLVIFETAESA